MLGEILTGGLYQQLGQSHQITPIMQRNQLATHGPLYLGSIGQNYIRNNTFNAESASPNRPSIQNDFDLYIDGCEETIEKDLQKTT